MSDKHCPNCERLSERIVALEQLVTRIEARLVEQNKIIETQAKRIRCLEDELAKYKKNSSKPPSSDIVKPPKP